jgi:hypothetical protein
MKHWSVGRPNSNKPHLWRSHGIWFCARVPFGKDILASGPTPFDAWREWIGSNNIAASLLPPWVL